MSELKLMSDIEHKGATAGLEVEATLTAMSPLRTEIETAGLFGLGAAAGPGTGATRT